MKRATGRPADVINQMYWGHDARDLLAVLPQTPFVTSIITSPPYFNLKDYGHSKQIGYNTRTIDEYLSELEKVFSQCRDVLFDNGTLWVVSDCVKFDGRLRPLPFLISERLDRMGWILQDVVVWRKDKTLPYSFPGRFRNLFEYLHLYSKTKNFKFHPHRVAERHKDERRLEGINGGNEARFLRGWPERYSALGANPGDVWDIPIVVQGTWNPHRKNGEAHRIHFCPFPQELVARILDLSTDPGDVVLDPFAGCGTVAAQAELMRRRYVGIELNQKYRSAYERVCANFSKEWPKLCDARTVEKQDRLEEGGLILKLRQVKHAAVWTRLVQTAVRTSRRLRLRRNRPTLWAVITIGRGDRGKVIRELLDGEGPKKLVYPLDVYFVFSNDRQSKVLDKIIEEQLAERSLRKYGLAPRAHVLAASELSPRELDLAPDKPMATYSLTRFYQCDATFAAAAMCKTIRERASSGRRPGFQFLASDVCVSLGHKTNVIEEAVKRFLRKLAQQSMQQFGGEPQAAEYLGVTRGELRRILQNGSRKRSGQFASSQ